MDIIFNVLDKVRLNHIHVVDIIWIVAAYGKVATETVTAIFSFAEAYFLSSMNEAWNEFERKNIVLKLLMNL